MILACVFLWSIIAYLAISRFVLQAVTVVGPSMHPTLRERQRLIMHRWLYYVRDPDRGDIVGIRLPHEKNLVVKRKIGIPLDRVQIVDGAVHVNGRRLEEPYLSAGTRTRGRALSTNVYRVSAGCDFVLGDNRGISDDSRAFGAVPREWIAGMVR